MKTQYFVNHKTRLCQMLSGRGPDHEANVAKAIQDGFAEVSCDELDEFRAETQAARDAGWNPNGRISYAKFIERNQKP